MWLRHEIVKFAKSYTSSSSRSFLLQATFARSQPVCLRFNQKSGLNKAPIYVHLLINMNAAGALSKLVRTQITLLPGTSDISLKNCRIDTIVVTAEKRIRVLSGSSCGACCSLCCVSPDISNALVRATPASWSFATSEHLVNQFVTFREKCPEHNCWEHYRVLQKKKVHLSLN